VRIVFACAIATPPLPAASAPLSLIALHWSMTTTYDRFEWDPALPVDTFEPAIGKDYVERAADPWPPVPTEATLIAGLLQFHALGGRYPLSLCALPLSAEISLIQGRQAALRIAARSAGREPPATDVAPDWPAGLSLYMYLWAEGGAPEYFGATVSASQGDAVLMRWKLPEGGMRIIYGDLRTETVRGQD
jgi:hypothetical protein